MEQIDFKLTKHNINNFVQKLHELDPEKIWHITVKPFKYNRSKSQNDYYWSMLDGFTKHMESGGYVTQRDDWHEYFKNRYLSEDKVIGKTTFKKVNSTTKLNEKEFAEYIKQIQGFVEKYGFMYD